MKVLIIVDMQNDFITGALGTPEAVSAKENIVNKICNMNEVEVENTFIFFTRDTHYENYMDTLEGKMLPILHCQFETDGWEIDSDIAVAADDFAQIVFDKITFGSTGLLEELEERKDTIDEIEICGVCTDICVISNALPIRMLFPNMKITIDSACCAGVTPEKHEAALEVMRSCQIEVV